ncbi:cytochrome-c oxidase, cbb3-type subunit III [Paracoccus sp. M683]|uniref:cytochrome-c oxidase, cbb3-type subunit III n=1 Tax=Paracoccus sp. M683 TaxID=2594268 RepID=UPI00117F0101|nr:cytochrome-c oxidase, cbb3-type subunit III [Paracoccus sp. M683]TRW99556.1 cytochrome-c oxidase, cbb3-type subunit III [Paracoccus sp. M683]
MSDKNKQDPITGVDTTGHDWDGIKELNNPLPRWWLWTLYGTIVWAIGYCIAYPAWPLIEGATAGVLGYSTRAEVAADIAAVDARNAEVNQRLASADLATLAVDDPAHQFGVAGGAAVFRANCSQCHGAGAAGAKGYPNLLDDDWLWGGTLDDVEYTVRHGIRNDADPDARFSQMPAFGELLSREEIADTTEHVLALSGQDHDAAMAGRGQQVFADNCAVCHADDGTGDPAQGAPDLTDAIWLYGGAREVVAETIEKARFGVMPAWGPRLTEAEIKAVTLYVHQLGGGE